VSNWKDRWKAAPQAVKAVVAAAVKPGQVTRLQREQRDSFYDETERWAAVNAGADQRGGRWIPRRRDWLQRSRT
jgi:hypothetical protein